MGHYMTGETHACINCGVVGSKDFEKQTDINLTLSLILDGLDNVYDTAYLLTADSDQAATARVFKDRLAVKKKRLVSVIPLNQIVSRKIANYAPDPIELTILEIERSVFPGPYVVSRGGTIRRPDKYEPPSHWVHPNDRKRRT